MGRVESREGRMTKGRGAGVLKRQGGRRTAGRRLIGKGRRRGK